MKPLGHLYRCQFCRLVECVGIPAEICLRPLTSDTYSAESTQEEFFFRLPHQTLDLVRYAREQRIPEQQVANEMELSPDQVRHEFNAFQRESLTTDDVLSRPLGGCDKNIAES